MSKYIVTGGAGFIGSHIVEQGLALGHDMIVVDNLSSGYAENIPPGATLHIADFADPTLLAKILPGAEGIFHLAAFIDLIKSYERPDECYQTNVARSAFLLDLALKHGVQRWVFSSSAAVYNPETKQIAPQSPYGKSKYQFELQLQASPISSYSLRYFNVYGPRQRPGSQYAAVIPKFFEQALANKAHTIYGEGSQKRDFVFVKEVASVNWKAMTSLAHSDSEITHCDIGTGTRTSILELSQTFEKVFNRKIARTFLPRPDGDADDSISHPEGAWKALSWKTEIALEEGLRQTRAWQEKIGFEASSKTDLPSKG